MTLLGKCWVFLLNCHRTCCNKPVFHSANLTSLIRFFQAPWVKYFRHRKTKCKNREARKSNIEIRIWAFLRILIDRNMLVCCRANRPPTQKIWTKSTVKNQVSIVNKRSINQLSTLVTKQTLKPIWNASRNWLRKWIITWTIASWTSNLANWQN